MKRRPESTLKRRVGVGLALSVLASVWAGEVRADSGARASNAQHQVDAAAGQVSSVQSAVRRAKGARLSPIQRLANGELLYRTKDYERASVVFSELIEEHPGTPAAAEALWLRGETYYASKELLSARRDYRAMVDRGSDPRHARFFTRALARLIDVSIRLDDTAELQALFQRIEQVPPSQVDASLRYAQGKALYFSKQNDAAARAFASVPNNSSVAHQARYFEGLAAIRRVSPTLGADVADEVAAGTLEAKAEAKKAKKRPNFRPAIEAFRKVTRLSPDTPRHRHVIDLAWMAIGRLFYEMDQHRQAAEAYSKIERSSPVFDTMLYELAWVYVRLGDVQRAERALEVLAVADPNSSFAGEGALLRADLLLRAGMFDKSLQVYQGVRAEYDPMLKKVSAFLDSTTDVTAYYDRLSEQDLDALDETHQLPKLAIRWAQEAEDGPAAFAVISDINHCRKLIEQSDQLVIRLKALLASSNRVRAFPELLAGEERAVGLLNQIAHARLEVARGLDDEEDSSLSGEIAEVRAKRRALMGAIGRTPVTTADFAERDHAGLRQWNKLSQELSRRSLEIDQLNAVINGLRRILREDAQHGVARDSESMERFRAELDANERALKEYRKAADELRRNIDIGRAQVGLGDSRYQKDAHRRNEFRALLEREVELAARGQGGSDATPFAQRVLPTLRRARSVEADLVRAFAALEAQVSTRVAEVQTKVDTEAVKLDGYRETLAVYDGEARDLVGHVAQRNFQLVREKLRNIVLRADVGITEQAWEVREEQLTRVRNLQAERAREEQILDEELREVLDDAGDSGDGGLP